MHKYIKKFSTILFLSGLFFCGHFASAETLNLLKDSEGWTIFTPSDDSRIVYISKSGNDATCNYYDDDDVKIGSDPFQPIGAILPCATYAKATTLTRNGQPDWILWKRGETFTESIVEPLYSGRSATEPALLGSYGTTGLSPVLQIPTTEAYNYGLRFWGTRKWIGVSGLDFYAYTRNPESQDYIPDSGIFSAAMGLYILNANTDPTEGILIEGCKFRYFTGGSDMRSTNEDTSILNIKDIVVYRSLFLNSWSDATHAGGIGGGNYNATYEENIFDHNGWHQSAAEGPLGNPTVFNHNSYVGGGRGVILRNNISTRPSHMHFKFTAGYGVGSSYDIVLDNNLAVDGEIFVSADNNYRETPWRFKNFSATNNVVTKLNTSRIRETNMQWGFEVDAWDGGLISGNLFADTDLSIPGYGFFAEIQGANRNVIIEDNFINDWDYMQGFVINSTVGESGNIIRNNVIGLGTSSNVSVLGDADVSGWSFYGNSYTSDRTTNMFTVGTTNYSLAGWQAFKEATATLDGSAYTDPNRTIETYLASIGETATLSNFYALIRSQDRYNWDHRMTASTVNSYIRSGFDMNYGGGDTIPPSAPANLSVL